MHNACVFLSCPLPFLRTEEESTQKKKSFLVHFLFVKNMFYNMAVIEVISQHILYFYIYLLLCRDGKNKQLGL